jgi:probable HAF family extracellular repeat protein
MKSRQPLIQSFVALSALLAMTQTATAQGASQQHGKNFRQYTVRDLGVLGSGTNSTGFDMNYAGWVAGSSNLVSGGPQHAFLWFGGGSLQDLGTLGGESCPQCNSAADGPSANGEAAIGSETSTVDPNGEDFCGYGTHLQCLGAVWRYGKLKVLPNLPGGHNANAFGINDLGQLVGFAESNVADPTCANATAFQTHRFQAVIWEKGGDIHVLEPLKHMGDTVGFAFGINSRGQVVGSSGTCGTQGLPPVNVTGLHAVIWERDGSPTYLGTLGDAANTMYNAASAINDQGDAVGTSQFTDGTVHSFLWKRVIGMRDLGTLPGAFATIVGCCDTVNNQDDVVGFSIDTFGITPFLWHDGAIVDLNSLMPANSSLYLLSASSINEAGEITGQACVLPACSELHAFRATPKVRNDQAWRELSEVKRSGWALDIMAPPPRFANSQEKWARLFVKARTGRVTHQQLRPLSAQL